jgi:putative oxidoreductase
MFTKPVAPAWGVTVVRLMMGTILMVASFEKLSGGGLSGFAGPMASYGFPVPQFWGAFVPLLEGIGGILVFTGLGARWVGLLFICEFVTTAFLIKVSRQPPFGGYESMRIDLMMLAAAIMLVISGPGALALERVLFKRRPAPLQSSPGVVRA